MLLYKCGVCGKERNIEDKRVLKLEREDGKPAIQPINTCVFCDFRVIPEGKTKEYKGEKS